MSCSELDRLRILLESGAIDPMLWMIHFPDSLDQRVPSCQECQDFEAGVCSGGSYPIDCFLEQCRKGAAGQ
jgi:hypothetical protein